MKTKDLLIELEELFSSIPDDELKNSIMSEFNSLTSKSKNNQIMISASKLLHNVLGSDFEELWKKELFNQWKEICEKATR